ncbi:MAG: hypothetical protein JW888_04735 [Pirellulales bacterium]|nr:hypothetical protein [Pirellulales bacterium]
MNPSRRMGTAHQNSLAVLIAVAVFFLGSVAPAATLTVVVDGGDRVATVGAFRRWNADGNPRRKVDPKAKIDSPEVDAKATPAGNGKWVFKNLPPGKYDLVILGRERLRIEGWEYAPVAEFDPFFPPTASVNKEARAWIVDDIAKSRHYENKVVPLAVGGNDRTARVLVMLIRDLPTSYVKGAGTLRFEIWQYTWNYGAWVKEKRTRVMHRLLLQVDQLRRWTWVWEPSLGAIDVNEKPVTVRYRMPKPNDLKHMPGLQPY